MGGVARPAPGMVERPLQDEGRPVARRLGEVVAGPPLERRRAVRFQATDPGAGEPQAAPQDQQP